MKAKEDSRDQIPSNLVWVKHIRRNLECPIKFTDPASEGWTPNNISLIRNISPYQPTNGIFSSDPDKRLFGLRYDYFGFKNDIRSSACLFGRTTVESWLGICEVATPERTHVHWAVMALLPSDKDTPIELQLHPRKYDPTNREGTAIIGRRLFWSHISPSGWGLNSLDYNPGAGIHICPDVQARGKLWQSYTSFYCKDPKTVSYSCTTRINGVNRIIPTEDGLLIKKVHFCVHPP
ncbi:hypothetical protein FB451DRAFT_726825 [Mycena latifolia]|nr:hypothetical protein FB451DRAFT_726825 [Mycena latifolia]